MAKSIIGAMLVAFTLGYGSAPASASSVAAPSGVTLLQALRPAGRSDHASYGPVAVSGATMAVGAQAYRGDGQVAGAVYVFTRPADVVGGWRRAAKLVASDGFLDDSFGYAIAVSGNTVAVGAPYANGHSGAASGAVYVFTRPARGWSGVLHERAKLVAGVGPQGLLGSSVAISGGTVIAGAPWADVGSHPSPHPPEGRVFAFNRPAHGWSGLVHPSARLAPPGGDLLEDFGQQRALVASGNDVFAAGGTSSASGGGASGGGIYAFHRPVRGWHGKVTPTARLGGTPEGLGVSVAAAGPTVITAGNCPRPRADACLFSRPARGWSHVVQPAAWFSFSIGGGPYGSPPSFAVSGGTIAAISDYIRKPPQTPLSTGNVFVLHEPMDGWSHHTYPVLEPAISLDTAARPNEIALEAHELFVAGTDSVNVYSIRNN